MIHTWFVQQAHVTCEADNEAVEEEKEPQWEPMRICDQRRLESALLAGQGKLVTFEVIGRLGLSIDPSGRVGDVCEGQAKKQGVQAGWQLVSVDDAPFSDSLMRERVISESPYRISFLTKALCTSRRPVVGDRVMHKDGNPVLMKDTHGNENAWELHPGQMATVVEVDEDDDFRLSNPIELESVFTYSKDYCYAQGEDVDEEIVDIVPVDGGRAEVRLRQRCLVDRYASVPPPPWRRVCRVLWVRHVADEEGNRQWQPFSEDADMLIEHAYQELVADTADHMNALTVTSQFKSEIELPPGCIEGDRGVVSLELNLSYNKADQKKVTFAPGLLGMDADWETGMVVGVHPVGQSVEAGVKAEMHFVSIDGVPYTEQILDQKIAGSKKYTVTFKETESWTEMWDLKAQERQITNLNPKWFGGAKTREKKSAMKRGYGDAPNCEGEEEEELLSEEISHLVILLHSSAHERASIASNQGSPAITLRHNLHKCQLQRAAMECATGDVIPDVKELPYHPAKAEVLEVAWDEGTRAGELDHALHERLKQITLPSTLHAREMVNHAAAGVLMYARYREEILCAVVESLESAVERFEEHHPHFNGIVLLVGHSLGGTALFDVLREQRLSFQARAFYALGSPIGLLLDASAAGSHAPGGTRLFNVFHPLDPVAYRVEPVLMPELEKKVAEKVPTLNKEEAANYSPTKVKEKAAEVLATTKEKASTAAQNLNQKAGKLFDWVADEFERQGWLPEIDDTPPPSRPPMLNDFVNDSISSAASEASTDMSSLEPRFPEMLLHGRLDWVIDGEAIPDFKPRSVSFLKSGKPSCDDIVTEALASHACYWRCEDVAYFILASSNSLMAGPQYDSLPTVGPLGQIGRHLSRTGEQFGRGLSKKWKQTGAQAGVNKAVDAASTAGSSLATSASQTFDKSGAADIVKGTAAAAYGVVGTARALYGTARLVGHGFHGASYAVGGAVSAVAGAVDKVSSPRPSPQT